MRGAECATGKGLSYGRFASGRTYVQFDPIGIGGGVNTYAYVEGRPSDSIDEDGLQRRAGPPSRANQNVLANAQANSLIRQIQQVNPQFTYPSVMSAPGQGGYQQQDVNFLRDVLQRAQQCNSCGGGNGVWPRTPQQMDQLLGFRGTSRPDLPSTPGRGKVVWEPSAGVRITFEQHPYHPTAPAFHCGPHWHLDYPGVRHQTFVPTELMP
jgi:hypothetical protein